MREIKFRAWNVKKGCFYVGSVGVMPAFSAKTYHSKDWGILVVSLLDQRYVLNQYTGLHDHNGVEIYEGDIVSRGTGRPWVIGEGLSFYQDVADMERFLQRGDSYEIIGNIYENPELLNG